LEQLPKYIRKLLPRIGLPAGICARIGSCHCRSACVCPIFRAVGVSQRARLGFVV
jgi:hypothetical protein